ncbi:MAG: VIT1/CCC1 family predicted Fe2+/Mn2+ transporter [Verrucomicrobiales bacterium]|jgi:VIT1/CCC1 family predicted Fe2+/Mn2+ transporter
MAFVAPEKILVLLVSATSLIALGALGSLSAKIGGARVLRATVRIIFWGAFAMALTAAVGKLFGAVNL